MKFECKLFTSRDVLSDSQSCQWLKFSVVIQRKYCYDDYYEYIDTTNIAKKYLKYPLLSSFHYFNIQNTQYFNDICVITNYM